jgi:hypothetical protein
MPFDGVPLIASAEDVLDTACAASGVVRIDYDTLERHKAVQLLAHPPGWGYRHRAAVVLAQAAVLAVGVFLFMLLSGHDAGQAGLDCLFGALGIAALPLLVRARGPARWVERDAPTLEGVHPEIRERALRLKARLPESGFRVGELFQDRILLDPYLVIDHRGATAIIGIWEGERVIA